MRNKTEPPEPARRTAGRPRDSRIDEAVRTAVLELLVEGGYGAVSIEAVAARAGVGRPTIYRRWNGKPHLVVDAIVHTMGSAPAPNTGSTRADLLAGVATLTRAFAGPVGRALPGLVGDLAGDPELARVFREQVFAVRRGSMATALARGVARGDLRPDLDVELVLDLLAAPLYYRALFGHAPLEPSTAESVVDLVLAAVAPPVPRPPTPRRKA